MTGSGAGVAVFVLLKCIIGLDGGLLSSMLQLQQRKVRVSVPWCRSITTEQHCATWQRFEQDDPREVMPAAWWSCGAGCISLAAGVMDVGVAVATSDNGCCVGGR